MAAAIVLTLISALAINWAYVREHEAASTLPTLSVRRPLHSLRILAGCRRWLVGFAIETGGFLCFVAALALAPLAIVQSLAAGGLGVLAFLSARMAGQRLLPREAAGVMIAMTGLALLGLSLTAGAKEGDGGSWWLVAVWLAGSSALAVLAMAAGRVVGATAYGAAAGLLFATGDVATEAVVSGGGRLAFAPAMVASYALGTGVLQMGFQRGGALATAGMATLLTNALPIVAGPVVYGEPFPDGPLRVVRIVSFGLIVAGGVLLAREAPRPGAAPAQDTSREVEAETARA